MMADCGGSIRLSTSWWRIDLCRGVWSLELFFRYDILILTYSYFYFLFLFNIFFIK